MLLHLIKSFLFPFYLLTSPLATTPLTHKSVVVQEEATVPLLDLQSFFSEEREEFIEKLRSALQTYGFVLIENHHLDQEILEKGYEAVRHFFSLPLEEKKKYEGSIRNRGYKSYQPERQDKKSDLQEYWHVGPLEPHLDPSLPSINPNIWPDEIPEFEESMSALYREIAETSLPLLEACSLIMGKEASYLSDITRHGESIMRTIHYLPSENQETVWKAAHQDPNLLTVIVGASKEGLELQLADGRWIKVPYIPNTMIVSASNMLESLSNGLIRSAPHRVVIQERQTSRFAIPFFFHVQRNLSIAPLPESVAQTGGGARYPNQTAEESLKGHPWFGIPQEKEKQD